MPTEKNSLEVSSLIARIRTMHLDKEIKLEVEKIIAECGDAEKKCF